MYRFYVGEGINENVHNMLVIELHAKKVDSLRVHVLVIIRIRQVHGPFRSFVQILFRKA